MRLRAFGAALAIAALGAGAAAAPAGAVPADFWGVVPQVTPSPEQFQRLKAGGVDSIRISISWSSVQPLRNGPFDFTGPDAIVGAAAAARIDVLPFLLNAPSWAVPSAAVPGTGGGIRAPKFLPVRSGAQRSGWRKFVVQVVKRYGPRGTFWTENPGLPKKAIRVWQIWNEPNFKYFVARPNPAEYGKLVKLSYGAVKAADKGARVILAGLFARPIEAEIKQGPPQAYFAADFLEGMYASTPGIKSKFQGYALHPYTGSYKNLTSRIEEVRAVLKANGDASKGLWVTELGWSSQPPRAGNSFAKGLGGQAAQLKGAFGLLRAKQPKWHVQRVYWFSVDDLKNACNFCDGSGLFANGFKPKPAWKAFVRFAGGTP
ncbi:MAG TPA: glycosyl hydrolase [Solirubrobacterales bacterium]|nr:glycosyl hydrolase [Solirubrobacterales bacterium]